MVLPFILTRVTNLLVTIESAPEFPYRVGFRFFYSGGSTKNKDAPAQVMTPGPLSPTSFLPASVLLPANLGRLMLLLFLLLLLLLLLLFLLLLPSLLLLLLLFFIFLHQPVKRGYS